MKKLRPGPGFTVFLLFFGISVIDAIRSENWFRMIFWIGTGLIFLFADNYKKNQENNR